MVKTLANIQAARKEQALAAKKAAYKAFLASKAPELEKTIANNVVARSMKIAKIENATDVLVQKFASEENGNADVQIEKPELIEKVEALRTASKFISESRKQTMNDLNVATRLGFSNDTLISQYEDLSILAARCAVMRVCAEAQLAADDEEIVTLDENGVIVEETPAVEDVIPEAPVIDENQAATAEEIPVENILEQPAETVAEEVAPCVAEAPVVNEEVPAVVEVAPVVEEAPVVAEQAPAVTEAPAEVNTENLVKAEEQEALDELVKSEINEENPVVAEEAPAEIVVEEVPTVEVSSEVPAVTEEAPVVAEEAPAEPAKTEEAPAEVVVEEAPAADGKTEEASNEEECCVPTIPEEFVSEDINDIDEIISKEILNSAECNKAAEDEFCGAQMSAKESKLMLSSVVKTTASAHDSLADMISSEMMA